MRGTVDAHYGMVVYEADLDNTDVTNDVAELTQYAFGAYPRMVNNVYDHQRDTANSPNLYPASSQRVVDIDTLIGGEPGAVNRFPYVINGIPQWEDFNLRGAAPRIPKSTYGGATGDTGNTDDYATYYARAIAAGAEATVTQEQSWAEISGYNGYE
jgi:hypothetical protein